MFLHQVARAPAAGAGHGTLSFQSPEEHLVNVLTHLRRRPAFFFVLVMTLTGAAVLAQTIERVRMTGVQT